MRLTFARMLEPVLMTTTPTPEQYHDLFILTCCPRLPSLVMQRVHLAATPRRWEPPGRAQTQSLIEKSYLSTLTSLVLAT